MSPSASADRAGADQLPWYVYDRHANLLHIADSLPGAEAWAVDHWGVVEVADREVVDQHDYWYLLLAASGKTAAFHSRDYQVRILRKDRVLAIGRDPNATPRDRLERDDT